MSDDLGRCTHWFFSCRYMDKYARLMQILQPISVEVFKGMCQLFELYIFTLFRLFGQREAFQTQKAGESSSCEASSALRCSNWSCSMCFREQCCACSLACSSPEYEELSSLAWFAQNSCRSLTFSSRLRDLLRTHTISSQFPSLAELSLSRLIQSAFRRSVDPAAALCSDARLSDSAFLPFSTDR